MKELSTKMYKTYPEDPVFLLQYDVLVSVPKSLEAVKRRVGTQIQNTMPNLYNSFGQLKEHLICTL
jgi:hypothetical protein